MSTAAKTLAALVFVALLGGVLTIPLRQNDDEPNERPRAIAPASPQISPSPSETERRRPRLLHRYPRFCLRRAQHSSGDGLIAAYRAGEVTIASPDGDVVSSFEARPPLSWSPSGRVIAAGPQGLFWTAAGKIVPIAHLQHGMVNDLRGSWAWSPIADCGLALNRHGELQFVTARAEAATRGVGIGTGLPLLKDPVKSFAISHDGRRVAVSLKLGQQTKLAVIDLGSHVIEVTEACCVPLGWAPDDETLFYYRPQGPSLDADGVAVRALLPSGRRLDVGVHITTRSIESCGERSIISESSWRDVTDHARLALVVPGQEPVFITDGQPSFMDPSCSQGGDLIAAVTTPIMFDGRAKQRDLLARRVVLLRGDGILIRPIADDPRMGDDAPDWGPSRTGLMFVRFRAAGRPLNVAAEVWFVPEGGFPRSTGLRVAEPVFYYGSFAWDRVIDWSATPPDGLPAG